MQIITCRSALIQGQQPGPRQGTVFTQRIADLCLRQVQQRRQYIEYLFRRQVTEQLAGLLQGVLSVDKSGEFQDTAIRCRQPGQR